MKKDKKDDIILQQLETIRVLTENNLRRMGGDFWGGENDSPLTPPPAPVKESNFGHSRSCPSSTVKKSLSAPTFPSM